MTKTCLVKKRKKRNEIKEPIFRSRHLKPVSCFVTYFSSSQIIQFYCMHVWKYSYLKNFIEMQILVSTAELVSLSKNISGNRKDWEAIHNQRN